MPAYVIAQMQVHDVEKYREYGMKVLPTVTPYGGRILVANDIDVREGSPPFPRTVMGEFPDLAAATAWYESPEYQAILPLRLESTTGILFMVEGLTMPDQPHAARIVQ